MIGDIGIKHIGLVLGGLLAVLILALLALAGLDRMSPYDFVRGYAEGRSTALESYEGRDLTPSQRGAVAFRYADFGGLSTDTLETHATPWRIAAATLALREVELRGGELTTGRVREAMRRFGFLYPQAIGNWPQGLAAPEAAVDAPLGLSLGLIRRNIPSINLTTANLSCASCHAGPTYDATGKPDTSTAWLGAPNTSLDLEAYVIGLYEAFKDVAGDDKRLLDAMQTLYPDTTESEFATIRSFILPRVRERMNKLIRAGDRPLPFVNGSPGITNGVAALRMQFRTLPAGAYESQRGFTSIPDLGDRAFRSALLYDGAYAPASQAPRRVLKSQDITPSHLDALAGVVSFFTVPSMGVHPDKAAESIPYARDVFDFLEGYSPPRFPGSIDTALATKGRDLYAQKCASCHGTYDASLDHPVLVEFPNWIGPYGADPIRREAFDAATITAIEKSSYGSRVLARSTGEYAAPLLSGLWLSAPYLHNGSVPTLWRLMTPSERPTRFMVGGHMLDYEEVGIAGYVDASGAYVYPPGYQPWSEPTMIDTQDRGYGSQGHEAEFTGLTDPEKQSLIEYLKLL